MVAITKTEKYKDTLSYISLLHDDAFKLINQAMDLGGSVQCELDNLPPSGFLPSCSVCLFFLLVRVLQRYIGGILSFSWSFLGLFGRMSKRPWSSFRFAF